MKGVMLAGGSGTRLRPITHSMAKQLVPVANRPILHYGLAHMAEAGIDEVCIIISPETGDDIRRSVGDGAAFGLEVTYVVQDAPRGLAHALACAMPWADGDDVLMYLGDNLVRDGLVDIVADFSTSRPNCQILLTRVDDPSSFGVAELSDTGAVERLVEKPSSPRSDLALVGVYLFDQTITGALEEIRPSARAELEITDAIQWLVDAGHRVDASIVRGWWKDTGRKEDLLHANQLVLRDLAEDVRGDVIGGQVRGSVQVDEGARVVDCDITGPVVIGRQADLRRCTIGPNTSIAAKCQLRDAHVEDSILMEDTRVDGWRLRSSLLGRSTRLGGSAPERFVELTLGEHSRIIGQ
ncbi:glucose-1-phosphate thymidylyltransferase [Salsipaludibacter albus]|uniref:glucose-1-phosphate thymidylyltransferase n=1 Tax=Salsipaludibacter albus TaxID=2849650 RepID=UPI001EE432AB|nr:glucose-1-phosphate thymidylyltransferase [Salsipaludibacter albus]MBY5162919.1 glucose-1-phosphate thymidylyltransferase [Salsipaludibacter albus]